MTAARVRHLITESGLTQAVFASKVGLDESKMSKSLSGVRRFTSLDLARIADLCGVSVDWLLGANPMTPSVAARTSTASLSAGDTAIQEAERLAQMRTDLVFLGYRQDVPKFEWSPTSTHPLDQGRDLAVQATQHAATKGIELWQSRDLAEAAENAFGVDVRIHRLPNGFDGLSWANGESSLIVVGTSEFPARQRFTIAHELGHLFAGDDQGLQIDANIHDADHKRKPSEKRANAFAAELLLPAEILKAEANTAWSRETFAKLVCRFWVSPSTLAWRLLNLGLIDRNLCNSFRTMTAWDAAGLAGSFESFGEWLQHTSTPRIPNLLVRATAQAYAEGKATLRPFANLIGLDTDTVRQAMGDTREDSPLSS